jgi:hypothetical protein
MSSKKLPILSPNSYGPFEDEPRMLEIPTLPLARSQEGQRSAFPADPWRKERRSHRHVGNVRCADLPGLSQFSNIA